MDIPLDVQVICKDGPAGRSKSIIVDPIHRMITHIVVAEKQIPHLERMVPLEVIMSTESASIQLRCTRKELATMDSFIEIEYLTEEGVCPEGKYQDRFYWPHVVPRDEVVIPIEIERIPLGEVAARRGMHVHAKDGRIGSLDEFLVDPINGHITHLILREGHLWRQRDITIPLSEIDRIEEDGVYLSLDISAIAALPSVPVQRRKQ